MFGGFAVALLIGVGCVAGVVALGVYIARGGGRLTPLWLVLLVLAVFITMWVWTIASIYFHMPVGWTIALGSSLLVVLALLVLVAKSVSWHGMRVAAAVGILVLALAVSTLVAIAVPTGGLFEPVFQARGQQIASDAGFDVLYPEDYRLKFDYQPIDALGGDPAEGVSMRYEGFELHERAAASGLGMRDLEDLLAPGEDPFGYDLNVPDDATYEVLEVGGQPALGVEFTLDAAGQTGRQGLPGKQSVIRILAFGAEGVDVRILTEGTMVYQGGSGPDERYEWVGPLEFDELVAVGESLEPLK